MMLRVRLLSTATALVLTLLLMTGLSGVARADSLLIATLTNAQENPPVFPTTSAGVPRPSGGTAVFSLNDAQTAMTMTVMISNIDVNGTQTPNETNDNLVAAHIHAPAPPGMNTGVVWGFFGAPQNTADDIMVFPLPAPGVGGMFTATWNLNEGNAGQTLTSQIGNLLGGLAYINFHTTQFPGGEIRGQIQLVPEPSSILLLLSGILGAVGLARRRISLS